MKHLTPLTQLKLLLVLALLLICTVGGVSAKYITTLNKGSTVKFTAELATDFILQEHEANRAADGTYSLSDTLIKDGQTYELIPGLDIPKDPHVVITGKSDIPAYLYIEIVESLDSAVINGINTKLVDYTVANCWKAVDESVKAPQYGGTVYVYTDGTSEQNVIILDGTTKDYKIDILNKNQVVVSQHVKSYDTDGTDLLTCYAYLIEVT